jgi:site-specific DNA recombinase
VGIVRVSRVGEDAVSPLEQRERIASTCERDGFELLDTLEGLDVSGGAPLARRHGLRAAVEMVEAGVVDLLIVAYFDRLVRSLAVQSQVVERVERAGGAILAVDVGRVTNGSAGQWLSGTMLGAVSEYHRCVTSERTADAKRRAIAEGRPTFPNVPPGYRKREDGRIEPHPEEATIVADAFRLRANGATVLEVRDFLRASGIDRSFHGTQSLLTSRIVLGELRFGELVNVDSHLPIVPLDVWQKVQKMRSVRGRRAKSGRLLSRLGILRCATCGGRMVVASQDQHGKRYYMYRCSPLGDCPRRVAISATIVEDVIVEETKRLIADMKGTATMADGIADAELALERSEQELDAAVRAFSGLEDVAATRERLLELRDARDRARDRFDELQDAARPAVTVTASGDWDSLTLEERRALIRAVIDRVEVAPGGRGRDRVTIHTRGQ